MYCTKPIEGFIYKLMYNVFEPLWNKNANVKSPQICKQYDTGV